MTPVWEGGEQIYTEVTLFLLLETKGVRNRL
jgi:hypothetical protein